MFAFFSKQERTQKLALFLLHYVPYTEKNYAKSLTNVLLSPELQHVAFWPADAASSRLVDFT